MSEQVLTAEQPSPTVQAETMLASAPRRVYTAPRLVAHGTVQAITQDTTGIDGTSGVDSP